MTRGADNSRSKVDTDVPRPKFEQSQWLKKGTQSPGKEQKSSEIQPKFRAKSSLNYIDVQFQPRNSDLFHSYMGICTLEIENEAGGPEITTDNQGKNIFVKFWDP